MSDRSESWFSKSIVYQIYPLSFQDSNGDGIGDLPGIISRLPYLADLGVTALWLCPFYPSPMGDHGYDIVDFTDVDHRFGTLKDFDKLLATAHKLGIKVMIDFVSNHTSSEHPWFKASRSSKQSPYRDWYVWRDPAPNGGPPNNWVSVLDNSAWSYDQATDQYYLHQFLYTQPDLNWRNPAVIKAMTDVMRFWFDRGVDGFRVDAISHLLEDEQFRNDMMWGPEEQPQGMHKNTNPLDPSKKGRFLYNSYMHRRTTDDPALANIIKTFDELAQSYPERFIICETYSANKIIAPMYAKSKAIGPFNFYLTSTECTVKSLTFTLESYSMPLYNMQTSVLGNHDQPRIANRWPKSATALAALFQFTIGGTPFIYYGDEIGMENLPIKRRSKKTAHSIPITDGFNANKNDDSWQRHQSRLPMQWSTTKKKGFTQGEPWMAPARGVKANKTVDKQLNDPDSLLNFYKNLIVLWKKHELYDARPVHISNSKTGCIAYDLVKDGTLIGTVMINPHAHQIEIPADVYARETHQHAPYTAFGTHMRTPKTSMQFPIEASHMLETHEGVLMLYRLKQKPAIKQAPRHNHPARPERPSRPMLPSKNELPA